MFLHGGTSSTTIEVSTGHTTTIGGGTNPLAGGIDGDGGLTKTGDGTLALTVANAYSGGTHIDAGKLEIGNSSSLGTGDVAMAAGTTLVFTVGGINIANDIGLTGDPIFFVDAGDIDSISGDITDTSPGPDAGEVEKTGAGTLVLSGDNTYCDLRARRLGAAPGRIRTSRQPDDPRPPLRSGLINSGILEIILRGPSGWGGNHPDFSAPPRAHAPR